MKLDKLEIKHIKLDEILPNPNNPKEHYVEGIKKSINDFGYVEPIVVDENNMILAGHGRLKALKEIQGQSTELVTVVVHRGLTENQKKNYLVRSNKLVELGGFNIEMLRTFTEEELLESGFTPDKLAEIFAQPEMAQDITDEAETGTFNFQIRCKTRADLEALNELLGASRFRMDYDDFKSWLNAHG